MKNPLSVLDSHPHIWRARQQPTSEDKFSLGIHALDKALRGGVNSSGVIRVSSLTGIGEISLFKRVLSEPRTHKLRVFINPPAHIQAPWLTTLGVNLEQVLVITPDTEKDILWAAEQCLKSTACHSVFLWNNSLHTQEARRLQVAATHNDTLCVLFSAPNLRATPLPITLDLQLHIRDTTLIVDIIKQRHGWPISNITIPYSWTPDNSAIQWAMLNNKCPLSELHSVS